MADRPRTVTKAYGRDAFIVALNPILAGLAVVMGTRIGLQSDAEVLDRMEKDSLEMISKGYQVVESDEIQIPVLWPGGRTSYYRVTYRLTT